MVAGDFKAGGQAPAPMRVPVPKPSSSVLVYEKGSALPPPPPPIPAGEDDGIPGEEAIRRAREQRERLRSGGRAADFIGLAGEGPRYAGKNESLIARNRTGSACG